MGIGLRRRHVLGGMASAALAARRALAAGEFAGRHLVAQGFGGPTQAAIQTLVFDPLDQRLGCRTAQVPLQSAAAFARMRAEAAAPEIDMYQFSGGQERLAAAAHLTADLGPLPNLADIPPALKDPHGQWVTFAVIAEGILYRTDKITAPPTSYLDFLDPRYQGHIALPTISNGYGTDFLVMMARATGGGVDDIDPGFQAIAKIAKGAIIFQAASQVPQLFAQADVWIMPYDSAWAKHCRDAGLPVAFVSPKEGSPASFCTTCIAAKSKNVDLARRAVDQFISLPSQAAIAGQLNWSPTNAKVQLPAALAAQLPKPSQLVVLDEKTMTERRPQWTERWNRMIVR